MELRASYEELGGRNFLKGSLKEEDLQLLLDSIEIGLPGTYPQAIQQQLQTLQRHWINNTNKPEEILFAGEIPIIKSEMQPQTQALKLSGFDIPVPYLQSTSEILSDGTIKSEPINNCLSMLPQNMQQFSCSKCGQECSTKRMLNSHLNKNHSDFYDSKCANCSKVFLVPENMTKHINRKHNKQKNYKCTYAGCNKMFITRKEQQNHIARHSNEKAFVCNHEGCNLAYTTKSSLDLHTTRIHGEKRHRCEFCDDAYAVRGDLNQHKKRKHSNMM